MVAMTPRRTVARRAEAARQHDGQHGQPSTDGTDPIWQYISSVASATDYIYLHPFSDLVNGVSVGLALLTGNGVAFHNALYRLAGWVKNSPVASLRAYVNKLFAMLEEQLRRQWARTLDLALTVVGEAWIQAHRLVMKERRERLAEVRQARAYSAKLDRALHQQIEREASSGYAMASPDRMTWIRRLADLIANDNPVVRGLVSDLVTGLEDLLTVDDPLARIALGFLLRKIISHAGTDQLVGRLLATLAAPILGQARPQNLHDVIADLVTRLGAMEGQWAQFFANGGSQVEHAGQEWQAEASPAVTIGLAAFTALAVTEPSAWAAGISELLGPPANLTLTALADTLGKA